MYSKFRLNKRTDAKARRVIYRAKLENRRKARVSQKRKSNVIRKLSDHQKSRMKTSQNIIKTQ